MSKKSNSEYAPNTAVIEIKPYPYQLIEIQASRLEDEFSIDWGDSNRETVSDGAFAGHNYFTDETYRITLSGSALNLIFYFYSCEYAKLLWFDIGCSTLDNAGYNFYGNFTGTVPEYLWTSGKYDISRGVFNFSGCYNLENYDEIPQAWKY